MVLWHILVIRFSGDFLYIFETWYMVFSIYSFSDGFWYHNTTRVQLSTNRLNRKENNFKRDKSNNNGTQSFNYIFYNGIIQTKYKENAKSKAY